MRIAAIVLIVLGLVAGFISGYGFFVSGVLELLPTLVAGIAVVVGFLALKVRTAIGRIENLEAEIRSHLGRTESITEQLRNEGLLSPTGSQTSDEEINAIL